MESYWWINIGWSLLPIRCRLIQGTSHKDQTHQDNQRKNIEEGPKKRKGNGKDSKDMIFDNSEFRHHIRMRLISISLLTYLLCILIINQEGIYLIPLQTINILPFLHLLSRCLLLLQFVQRDHRCR